MKNKIGDLRDHLFAQLERLGNEEMDADQLDQEIKRAKSMREVADGIISSAKAETDRLNIIGEYGIKSGSALMSEIEEARMISHGGKS